MFLFDELPWLRETLAWVVAVLLLWLIFSPVFYLLYPLIRRLRERVGMGVARFVASRETASAKRRDATESALATFRKSRLRRLTDSHYHNWRKVVSTIVEPIEGVLKEQRALAAQIRSASERASDAQRRLTRLQPDWPGVPVVPDVKEIAEGAGGTRIAFVQLVLFTLVLAAAVTANTGMLSQILVEIQMIPADLTYGGFALSYVLALLITIIEAGIGVLHGFFSGDEHEQPQVPLVRPGALAFLLLALMMACVEGYFYSRVGASAGASATYTIPGLELTLTMETLFFMWGIVLVLTLFGLGLAWYKSLMSTLRGKGLRSLRRRLRKTRKEAGRLEDVINRTGGALEAVRSAREAEGDLENKALEEIERVKGAVTGLTSRVPEWAVITSMELTDGEIRKLELRTTFYLGMTLVVAAASAWVLASIVGTLYPGLSRSVPVVAGIGETALFIALGFWLRPDVVVVQGAASGQTPSPPVGVDGPGASGDAAVAAAIAESGRWPRVFAVVGILVLAAMHVGLLGADVIPRGYAALWLLLLGLGFVLVALGRELSSFIDLVGAYLGAALRRLIDLGGALSTAVIRLLQSVTVVVDFVVELLAVPIARFVAWRRGGQPAPIDEVPPRASLP